MRRPKGRVDLSSVGFADHCRNPADAIDGLIVGVQAKRQG